MDNSLPPHVGHYKHVVNDIKETCVATVLGSDDVYDGYLPRQKEAKDEGVTYLVNIVDSYNRDGGTQPPTACEKCEGRKRDVWFPLGERGRIRTFNAKRVIYRKASNKELFDYVGENIHKIS